MFRLTHTCTHTVGKFSRNVGQMCNLCRRIQDKQTWTGMREMFHFPKLLNFFFKFFFILRQSGVRWREEKTTAEVCLRRGQGFGSWTVVGESVNEMNEAGMLAVWKEDVDEPLTGPYDGQNIMCPQRFICLKTWSPACSSVLRDYGTFGAGECLEKVGHWKRIIG